MALTTSMEGVPRKAAADRTVALAWSQRLDLLVHALAQLPDDVTLEVDATHPDLRHVELLATAYGIRDRIAIGEASEAPEGRIRRSLPPLSPVAPPSFGSFRSMAELVQSLSRPDDPPASLRFRDGVFAGQRIALITNVPAHYRLPLFAGMERRIHDGGGDFRVFFLGTRASSRPWLVRDLAEEFPHEFLTSLELPIGSRRRLVPLALERRLRAFRPTLLLSGGFSPAVSGRVARFAGRARVPWGIWSGETAQMNTAASGARRRQRLALARSAAFGIAYGHRAGEYLKELRSDLPVVYGRNTAPTAAAAGGGAPEAGDLELLFVGDLADRRKGVDVALEALRRNRELRCRLTVVGSGRLLSSVAEQAREDRRVRFAGALSPDETRRLYAAADIFLFPTRSDVFGLVLVEALGAGIATIASDAAGSVDDVAINGHNSVVLSAHDPDAWAGAIAALAEDARRRVALGDEGALTIRRRWTIAHAVDAMVAGLRLALLNGDAT